MFKHPDCITMPTKDEHHCAAEHLAEELRKEVVDGTEVNKSKQITDNE